MAATVKVWDPLVRIFHWTLVGSFALAWISADEWDDLHSWAGYAAAALIAFRLVWGLLGPRYARFRQFIRAPGTVAAYLKDVLLGREARYLGHNPAGGAMIIALIVTLAMLCLTGWMYTLDIFWGEDWVEEIHEVLANLMLGLIGLHLAGVFVASLKHHENLVRAMITGRKRSPTSSDVN
ncbi:cytochrome B [Pelagibius litoralis]|uniref:Cytochrome B n=1 Tax=Pelagibius litoralis TaxID=374515 RepID=A0A967F1T8_9PROT|nr:cytochrome b/b6 domain-containing protein [Pelagibius litoralis]NIA71559.1 cytochrome B [Pelagibius litoralis]